MCLRLLLPLRIYLYVSTHAQHTCTHKPHVYTHTRVKMESLSTARIDIYTHIYTHRPHTDTQTRAILQWTYTPHMYTHTRVTVKSHSTAFICIYTHTYHIYTRRPHIYTQTRVILQWTHTTHICTHTRVTEESIITGIHLHIYTHTPHTYTQSTYIHVGCMRKPESYIVQSQSSPELKSNYSSSHSIHIYTCGLHAQIWVIHSPVTVIPRSEIQLSIFTLNPHIYMRVACANPSHTFSSHSPPQIWNPVIHLHTQSTYIHVGCINQFWWLCLGWMELHAHTPVTVHRIYHRSKIQSFILINTLLINRLYK